MANFDDTAAALMLGNPFFAQLFFRYRHRATDSIPTLAVGVREFLYNPQFLASLSDDVAVAGFAHEVMHGVFQHVQMQRDYFKTGVGPDGKPFDPERWAQAIDYCVNRAVFDAGIGKLGDNWYFSPKYTEDWTPQEIYADLAKNPPPPQGNSPDEHGTPDDEEAEIDDAEPAITPEAVIAAGRAAKAMGQMTPQLERLLGEVVRPKSNPWAVLQASIGRALGRLRSTSYRHLQRRLVVRGIGAPGVRRHGIGAVGIVPDISGSITPDVLAVFAGHIELILRTQKPEVVHVAWTDDAVRRIDTVTKMDTLRQSLRKPFNGSGMTDMRAGITALHDRGCDVIVVLTDGYTPFPERTYVPLIWAMTTDQLAPIGRNIRI